MTKSRPLGGGKMDTAAAQCELFHLADRPFVEVEKPVAGQGMSNLIDSFDRGGRVAGFGAFRENPVLPIGPA